MDNTDLNIADFAKLVDLPVSIVTFMYIVNVLEKRVSRTQAMLEHVIESLISIRLNSTKE